MPGASRACSGSTRCTPVLLSGATKVYPSKLPGVRTCRPLRRGGSSGLASASVAALVAGHNRHPERSEIVRQQHRRSLAEPEHARLAPGILERQHQRPSSRRTCQQH
jgi:hypothetical protein